jgi:hypothetical protein
MLSADACRHRRVSSSSLLAPTIITPSESHEIDRSVILIGREGGQVPRVRLHCVLSRPFYDDQMGHLPGRSSPLSLSKRTKGDNSRSVLIRSV